MIVGDVVQGVIGDLGQTDNSIDTLDHMAAQQPQSILNVGELASQRVSAPASLLSQLSVCSTWAVRHFQVFACNMRKAVAWLRAAVLPCLRTT